jgi:predicted aspartyl protease
LLQLPGLAGGSQGEKITLRDGFAFVSATINGHGPFRLLIDTGAVSCILTAEAAHEAGLVYDHRVILTTMSGEKIIAGASDNMVQVGAGQQSGVEIVVTELPEVRTLDSKADGVLGQSFFAGSAYLIDYKAKRLWLGEDAVERSKVLPVAVQAQRVRGRTVLPVMLGPGTQPWRLTLDSGASDLVVECSERCPPATGIQGDARLLTYLGERPVSRGKISRVEIGGVAMPSVQAVLVDSPSLDGQDEGVLPTRWFSAVYVDSSTVRLAPAR